MIHKGTNTIKTKRLILRRFVINDAQDMFSNWASDENTVKYLSWQIHTSVEVTKLRLAKLISEYQRSDYYNWVIEYNGKIVGNIDIHDLSERNSYGELGYCLGSKYWNKGIMTEAVGAVIEYLFDKVGMHRIIAMHDTKNIASGRVMQKNNMTHEGILREHLYRKDGSYGDLACYGILIDEWRKINAYT